MAEKSLKEYCKDAKKRLKSGFWQDYKKDLTEKMSEATENGVSASAIREYYSKKVASDIKNSKDDFEEFYLKVARILDEEGEISGVISRLTDSEVYASLSYEEQQRYNLTLSEKYLKALERYKKEKSLKI